MQDGDSAFRTFIASANQGNDFYETPADVSSLLLNNFYTELQVIVDHKFDRPLGATPSEARGTRAENYRSGRSLRNIRLNLLSLHDMFLKAFAPRLTDQELVTRVDQLFTTAIKTLDDIKLPLDQAVEDPKARLAVVNSRMQASDLKSLVGSSLPQQLKLPLGFNSLDGD